MSREVHVIDHPLVQHKLTLMRRKDTSTKSFRELVHELSALLAYEITRDMPMQEIQIETPLEKMTSRVIDGKKVVLASILRAGNGFLDGMLQVIPGARVGHIGLYRDPKTLQPVQYYCKLPEQLEDRVTIVVDPMLATGNSSAAAVDLIKAKGAFHYTVIDAQTGLAMGTVGLQRIDEVIVNGSSDQTRDAEQ